MVKKSFFDKLFGTKPTKKTVVQKEIKVSAPPKSSFKVSEMQYGNIPSPKTRKQADDLNKEFRQSDNERWSQMDFVVGIEIRQSNNPKLNRECCKLLAGKYPKSFNWHGWFEGCACHSISVLATEDELLKSLNKDTKIKSKNEVVDYPDNFKTMAGFKKTDKLTKKQAEQAYKKIYELYNTKK